MAHAWRLQEEGRARYSAGVRFLTSDRCRPARPSMWSWGVRVIPAWPALAMALVVSKAGHPSLRGPCFDMLETDLALLLKAL